MSPASLLLLLLLSTAPCFSTSTTSVSSLKKSPLKLKSISPARSLRLSLSPSFIGGIRGGAQYGGNPGGSYVPDGMPGGGNMSSDNMGSDNMGSDEWYGQGGPSGNSQYSQDPYTSPYSPSPPAAGATTPSPLLQTISRTSFSIYFFILTWRAVHLYELADQVRGAKRFMLVGPTVGLFLASIAGLFVCVRGGECLFWGDIFGREWRNQHRQQVASNKQQATNSKQQTASTGKQQATISH